ncbi:MAG: outer membrane protein assembly factor BamE, partial [bacterium]
MKKTYTIICRVVTVLFITGTVACAPLIGTHGNLVDLQTVKKIQPDLQSKTDVVTLLGEPSTTSTFDPNIWFYIGQRTETIAFFKPEITEQRVLALSFDPQNKVEAVV